MIWTIAAIIVAFFVLRFLWRMLQGSFALVMEIDRLPPTEKELARGRRLAGILMLLAMLGVPLAIIAFDTYRRFH